MLRHLHYTLAIAFLLLTACLSETLLAYESSSSQNLYTLSLQDLLNIKISSATLTPKSLKTAPSSISVITRSDIDNLPYRYLHELLNHVPGFQAFRQAEAADEYYHSARGRRVGTASREVLILINGTRFNRETDNAAGVPGILLNNIEKIELIRGPGSALYGSNAFMGVVSITTVKGVNAASATVSGKGMYSVSGNLNGVSKEWQYDLFAHAETGNGHELTIENNFDGSALDTRDGTEKLDVRLDITHAGFALELAHYQREAEDFYILENVSNRNHSSNNFSVATVKNRFDFSENWQLSVKFGTTSATYEPQTVLAQAGFANDFGGSVPPSEEPYKVNAFQKERTHSFSYFNNWKLNNTQSVQLGGEFRKVKQYGVTLNSNFDLSVSPIVYVGDAMTVETLVTEPSNTDIFGSYLQYQHSLGAKLDLILGVRHDDYSDIDHALSPRAALIWDLHTQHTVKLLYGSAFRAPTTNERYLTGNVTVIGNPDLQPEEVDTLELNWLYNNTVLGTEISIYESTITKAIQQDFIGSTRTFLNSEDDEVIRGLEAGLTWYVSKQFKTSLSATHIGDLPESQFRQADNFASLQLDYHGNNWHWNVSTVYAGKRRMQVEDALIDLGSYLLCATKLAYVLDNSQNISLSISNAFDEDYLTPSQGQILTTGIPNPGREMYVKYAVSF